MFFDLPGNTYSAHHRHGRTFHQHWYCTHNYCRTIGSDCCNYPYRSSIYIIMHMHSAITLICIHYNSVRKRTQQNKYVSDPLFLTEKNGFVTIFGSFWNGVLTCVWHYGILQKRMGIIRIKSGSFKFKLFINFFNIALFFYFYMLYSLCGKWRYLWQN